ncbi:MAG: ABC transporter substrate-binding protein [Aggregatilineales bacterium]
MKQSRISALRVLSVALIAILAFAGLSNASARPAAAAGGELVYAVSTKFDTLDPNVTTFTSVGRITIHVVEPLVWETDLGKFSAGLATSWSVNDTATEYTFKLRQGVKFTDGTPFNAAAVKFTFDRIMDPNTKSQTAISLMGPYQETDVIDDYDVVVKFKSPYAPFLDSVSNPYLGIVSPDAVKAAGKDWGVSKLVGTGPFMLQSYIPDSEVDLVRNPDYNWAPAFAKNKGPAQLEKLTYKIIDEPATRLAALQSGEVQAIEDVPEQNVPDLKQDPTYTVVEVSQPGSGWSLQMNVQNPPTDDLAVRKAIALGSDKQGMIKTVWNGLGMPGCGPLTHSMFGFDPMSCNYLPYDPVQAQKILDADGWVVGSDGIRVKNGTRLVIQHWFRSDSAVTSAMATFMQADLKKIGIDVNLNGASQSGYFDAVRAGKHNTQNWWDTGTDPDAMVRELFYSTNANGGTNRSRYVNPDMDKLIDQAAGSPDPTTRLQLYAQIQKKVADDAIMVFYNDPVQLYAYSNQVQGVTSLLGGNYLYFYDATVGS